MADRVLLVEDRDNLRALLARALGEAFDVDVAADGRAALGRLATERYAVVVTDVRLPEGSGEAVLAEARRKEPPPEVVMMTAFAEVPAAVAALKAGAYDYLAKPFEPAELLRVVRRAAERHGLLHRARQLEAELEAREGALIGASPAMAEVRRLLERVGPLPVPVLLAGESGTGKEVAARELHRLYGRGRFVPVHCGAIPENLLEAELFGWARGAFSGAVAERRGLFEEADGGVLFLDEIGDMPLAVQVKLNRALEEGEVRRIGENRARAVDVRVVAATHRDLARMVDEGTFRADLFFRLKVVQIRMPPLRDRRGDVALLATRFLARAAARFGSRARALHPDALAALEAADWPGNVRELRHAIEHAVALAEGEEVLVGDLPEGPRAAAPRPKAGTWREVVETARDRAAREYLVELLKRTGGNVTRAAEEADVERETFHRLLRRHGVEAGRFRG
ncbi:MAG: sigma-54-dependent transcriptional regulator [Myxococcota bacterium]